MSSRDILVKIWVKSLCLYEGKTDILRQSRFWVTPVERRLNKV